MKLGVFPFKKDALIPHYATEESACFDITIPVSDSLVYVEIPPGEVVKFGTGLKLDIPKGYQLKMYPRSSTGIKKDLELANTIGVIDSDYVDELIIALRNVGDTSYFVYSGSTLVQAELQKVIQCEFVALEEAPKQKTSRNGGIGSTDA